MNNPKVQFFLSALCALLWVVMAVSQFVKGADTAYLCTLAAVLFTISASRRYRDMKNNK